MCSFIVTDEEIEKAEKDIFLGLGTFTEEQKDFLRCLDSCFLQAYAGAGKTSTLVGKLHILAQKQVWNFGRAICVISHTNIAIDEIKKHVAKHYPSIMEYPNFVGTIQEFANKFFLTPYLASKGLQLKFQEERRYLDYKKDGSPELKARLLNKIKQISHIGGDAVARFANEFSRLCIYNSKVCTNPDLKEYKALTTKGFLQSDSDLSINALIKKQHEKGTFLFIESFIYGLEYLKENPLYRSILSTRFQFILLDEAQDCSRIQLDLLKKVFGDENENVFQQVGDINQSISENQWSIEEPLLVLGQSLRCGSDLTSFINKFRVDDPKSKGIIGCARPTKKILFLYKGQAGQNLLEAFSEVLTKESIPMNKDKGYFVIAHEHSQLASCFPDLYSKEVATNKKQSKSLRLNEDSQYLNLLTDIAIMERGVQFVYFILLSLLYKYFKEKGTWLELKNSIVYEESPFRKIITSVSNEVLKNGFIADTSKLQNELNSILGTDSIEFTSITLAEEVSVEVAKINRYESARGHMLNIGTIHSVKGQTHNATLFISDPIQKWKKTDIEHATQVTKKVGETAVRYKKLIYVASSRPQDLYGIAVEESIYNSLSDKSLFDGFEQVNANLYG